MQELNSVHFEQQIRFADGAVNYIARVFNLFAAMKYNGLR